MFRKIVLVLVIMKVIFFRMLSHKNVVSTGHGLTTFVLLILMNSVVYAQEARQPVEFVDPLIGSGDHGHVFVGANVPFGAVQAGPNNIYKGWDWCSGYHYSDSLIIGFSHAHLSGTGIGDLGDVLIMPFTGDIRTDKGKQEYPHNGYLSTFSHKNETASAGYYSVTMDNGVKVALSATERVAYHRYYFPKNEIARIIIDLKEGTGDRATETSLRLVDEYTLLGKRFSSGWAKEQQIFFAIRFSIPVKDLLIYDDNRLAEGTDGKALKGLITMKDVPDLVELKVGISPVSESNALANIEAEIPGWDFDQVVSDAKRKWNHELSKISVETRDDTQKRIFYTALYHAFMHPSLFNDHNGDYQGADNKVYKKAAFNNYTIFSTWDTYRAAHPLFTLVQGERVKDFVRSMLAIAGEQGHLPVWHLNGYETGTMVGISSLQIIAEACLKGYLRDDAEKAYDAIRATAMSDVRGLGYVQKLQPIPCDAKFSRTVGHGLELALSDGSIALMAKALGKKKDYEYFTQRASSYKLYYDSQAGFFRGRMSDGSWNPVFDPVKSSKPWAQDYAEGNAWQYLWLAPHDVAGLMNLLGGEQTFTKRLDEFFSLASAEGSEVLVDLTGTIGQYAHGNEPSHHIAYLYNYAGQPWKTAEKVRHIMNEFYHDKPGGLIGNEDCGQMSSWYVFSALGFYPVFPASGQYIVGSPLFDSAVIDVGNGRRFIIETKNNGPGNIYIQSMTLNGRKHGRSFISHEDIMKGGTLKVTMGSTPNVAFGSAQQHRP